jgi:hypothetical protein
LARIVIQRNAIEFETQSGQARLITEDEKNPAHRQYDAIARNGNRDDGPLRRRYFPAAK